MTATVPSSTRIRRSRVGNIDTDRLTRRARHLRGVLLFEGHTFATRHNFVMRAAEFSAINRELGRRGDPVVALDDPGDE